MDETEKIMESIVKAHNDYVKPSTHPSDITDWTNAIHTLQDILTRRILRRDYPKDFITVKQKLTMNQF